jgi:predicted glycosyltransferase
MDILTPKQARFLSKLGERLRSNGVDVSYTTRGYYESERMLRLLGIRATMLGRWGGNMLEKALFSARRTEAYVKLLAEIKPNLVFTFGSPEAARASYGLGIPHMMANDSPHAEAVMRLTIPLSRKLFAPWVIPKAAWTGFGIPKDDVVQYKGLDQAAWMKELKIADSDARPKDRLFVIYRPEEFRAAYVGAQEPSSAKTVRQTLGILRTRLGRKVRVVVLARYGHSSMYHRLLGSSVMIPRGPVDGVEQLRVASAFLGCGGTMTGEAALSGALTISLSPRPNAIERFLMREKLVFQPSSARDIADLILTFYDDEKKSKQLRERASALLRRMEDPTEKICEFLLKWRS